MVNQNIVRFPIRFDAWYRALSSALFLPPANAWVEVAAGEVRVRMAWAFQCAFPRAAIAAVATTDKRPFSRGVHGFGGRWLVNGSGQGMVAIDLEPEQHACVSGFRVRLRHLLLSVEAPQALVEALAR